MSTETLKKFLTGQHQNSDGEFYCVTNKVQGCQGWGGVPSKERPYLPSFKNQERLHC